METKTAFVFDWPPKIIKLNKEKVENSDRIKVLNNIIENKHNELFKSALEFANRYIDILAESGCYFIDIFFDTRARNECKFGGYIPHIKITYKVAEQLKKEGFKVKVCSKDNIEVTIPTNNNNYKFSS